MLASVLNNRRAIQMNIQIVRIFIKLRELLGSHKESLTRLNKLENKVAKLDDQFLIFLKHLKNLEKAKQERDKQNSKKPISYKRNDEQ